MFYVFCFLFCIFCFAFYVSCFMLYVLCLTFFYVLCFMFCVLCFMFYVFCLCFVFYVPRTKTKNQSPKVLIEIGVLVLGTRLKLQLVPSTWYLILIFYAINFVRLVP